MTEGRWHVGSGTASGHHLRGGRTGRGVHRHRVPGAAGLRAGRGAHAPSRAEGRRGAAVPSQPCRPGTRRGPERGQRHRLPRPVRPYYAEVVLGYEEVVAELGRSVLILATNGRRNAADAMLELAGRVDGMVNMGRTVPDSVVVRIADTGLPLV